MNGDAASIYAARRLQLAAAGSSPKALLAAVVTTATMFRQLVCRWRMDRVVGRKTDKCEMDRCDVFRGCDEKTAGPATGSGIAAEVGSAVWIVEPEA